MGPEFKPRVFSGQSEPVLWQSKVPSPYSAPGWQGSVRNKGSLCNPCNQCQGYVCSYWLGLVGIELHISAGMTLQYASQRFKVAMKLFLRHVPSMPKERSTIGTADRETAAVPVREMPWQVPSQLASLMGKALDLRAAASVQNKRKWSGPSREQMHKSGFIHMHPSLVQSEVAKTALTSNLCAKEETVARQLF